MFTFWLLLMRLVIIWFLISKVVWVHFKPAIESFFNKNKKNVWKRWFFSIFYVFPSNCKTFVYYSIIVIMLQK